jgi:AMP nucleosidase
LRKIKAMAIDMETATIFTVAFANKIPAGALLLVTDQPMIPEGVKTEEKDKVVTQQFTEMHLDIGIKSLLEIKNQGISVRHLKF